MSGFFEVIKWMVIGGTLLTITFVILLALPQSRLREFMTPIVGWAMAVFCGVYAISPIDVAPEAFLGPFGLIDDIGAVVVGIVAARAAMKAGKGG